MAPVAVAATLKLADCPTILATPAGSAVMTGAVTLAFTVSVAGWLVTGPASLLTMAR